MSLTSMKDILKKARQNKYCIGGFFLWNYDSARAIADAAQKLHLPIIYIIGYYECQYMGGLKNVRKLVESIAETVDVPVVLHADHFADYDKISEAIDCGFSSVMIDASRYPLEENIKITKKVVDLAKPAGISVEAELGRIGNPDMPVDFSSAESIQTDPDEAKCFVDSTGIDALAVAIGTVHGAYKFKPNINIPRLKKIAAKVTIPLVMHGGSGTPEDKILEAVQNGVSKLNVATDVVTVISKKMNSLMQNKDLAYSVKDLYEPSRIALTEFIEQKMRLLSANALKK